MHKDIGIYLFNWLCLCIFKLVLYLISTLGKTQSKKIIITKSSDAYSLTIAAGKYNQALHIWKALWHAR